MGEVKLVEVDYAILGVLPEEGTKLGFTLLAKQGKAIVKDLRESLPPDQRDGTPTHAQVNGRLRALKLGGYVIDHAVQPVSGGQGWQRTPKGTRLLSEHEAATTPQQEVPAEEVLGRGIGGGGF